MKRSFFAQIYFALAFLGAMLMLAIEVPAWIAVFSLIIVLWKWAAEAKKWKPLPRRWTGVLSILLLIQVLVQFRTLIGQEPAYTFLLGLSALRVMDYENERDHKFLVLLGFVLVSVKALFSLDIYWILPSALCFAGLWFSLLPAHLPQRTSALAKIFLISTPLALILFFAFPRFVLPWAMSRSSSSYGEVGFSDEMNPGRVAELATNLETAFRAKIQNLDQKRIRDLYWRGSVLSESRGLSWRPQRVGLQTPPNINHSLATYEVALEPTGQNFIFVLDGTVNVVMENPVMPLRYSLFRSTRPITKTTVYQGFWDENFVDNQTPAEEFLQTPPLRGRVLDFVESIQDRNLDETGRLAELEKFFSDKGFAYTLSPGIYGVNDLEAFLFHRKRGFCEHFAGSYATLARALGIPARVVVGYHGGKYNPRGEFWKVSQRDAHAWVEVYTQGAWRRVDPTNWVAPLRLSLGGEEFFNLSEEEQSAFARSMDWRPSQTQSLWGWDDLSYWFEDLNYRWTYFLVEFDRGSQQSFWKGIGAYKAEAIVIVLLVILLFVLIFRSLFRQKDLLNEEQVLLQAIERWGTSQRVPRDPAETPLQYFEKLSEKFPQTRSVLEMVQEHYDSVVYAQKAPSSSSKELLKLWKKVGKKVPGTFFPS
ncbi:DUF3488 and transglutaminase-like domain-containing protein [Bdellovibrio sp. 22V]|uniref:transglutaminase TgpA family protein n=1 Tax=Bdellovibrio TaxID=958 RepID=UPI0025437FE9|nr:DUF3488 and transglutaminase-like domain-containing protein [Bdellovibrio sp. 22V]WII73048.1 DUF3488 and transglutaminase-like domain-containing protein [Bdellovibrio sp. 22V]